MKSHWFWILILLVLIQSGCDQTEEGRTSVYAQYGTPYVQVPATGDIVMYEVNLRAFSAAGTLQGVINRLDELQKLGINTIWLMPIHPIGTVNSVNSPYSVRDYKAVASEYGTLEDLRALTTQAHAKGMAVILDWVANHTAWDHPWIQQHKDWYTQDANGKIIAPAGTNWADVADLNFAQSEMRKGMIDAMEYWVMEANVDGFRCDYADGIPTDFWHEAITELRALRGRKLIFLAEGTRYDHYTAGFDLTYSWDFYAKLKDVYGGRIVTSLFTTHAAEYNGIPEGKHKLRFTTNHDESAWQNTPMVYFDGKAGALAASIPTLLYGGVPLFYTGQEVGRLTKLPFFTKSPINWSDNPDMLNAYQTLMQIRANSEALRKGTVTTYTNGNILAFQKALNGKQVFVLVNLRNYANAFTVPAALQNTTWINLVTQSPLTLGSTLNLGGYEYLILGNE